MNADADPLYQKIADALTEVVRTNRLDRNALAERFGVSKRQFDYWLSADRPIPLHVLPRLCRHIEAEACRLKEVDHYHPAYSAMDILEESVGRHAFGLFPINENIPSDDLRAIQRLVKEVGEALEKLSSSLADGIVTEKEKLETIPELDDVIRECGRLKKWLHVRCEVDQEKLQRKARFDAASARD